MKGTSNMGKATGASNVDVNHLKMKGTSYPCTEGSYFFFRCKSSKNDNYIQLSLLKGKDFLTIKQKFIIHQLILK